MKRFSFVALSLVGLAATAPCAVVRLDAVDAGNGESAYTTAVKSGGYAFFASSATPLSGGFYSSRITRVGISPFAYTSAMTLLVNSTAGQPLTALAVNDADGFLIAASSRPTNSGVARVRLSDDTQVSTRTLAGSGPILCAILDPSTSYVYLGTFEVPGRILKVDVNSLIVVSSVALSSGRNYLTTALIDSDHTYGYFGSSTTPGIVTKVRLSDLSEVAAVTFGSGESGVASGFLDETSGDAWFGTYDSPAKVIRVRISDMTRRSALTFQSAEDNATSVFYNPVDFYAYFGTRTQPGRIVRIRPRNMARVDALVLDSGENDLLSVVGDAVNQYAYFGTYTAPGRVVQVDLIGGPPEITQDVSSPNVPANSAATFAVTARGRGLSYQWYRNGGVIAGATASAYTIASVSLNDDQASFYCTVTNSSGTATSSTALLTVQPEVHAYPNPWRADRHSGVPIRFNGLPAHAEVRLFTLAGQWVKTVPVGGSGIASWDLQNDAGESVASGYYLYYVRTANDSQKIRGKFAVIR